MTSSVLLLLIKYTLCDTHLDVAGVYIIRVTVFSQNYSGVIICKNKEKTRMSYSELDQLAIDMKSEWFLGANVDG